MCNNGDGAEQQGTAVEKIGESEENVEHGR